LQHGSACSMAVLARQYRCDFCCHSNAQGDAAGLVAELVAHGVFAASKLVHGSACAAAAGCRCAQQCTGRLPAMHWEMLLARAWHGQHTASSYQPATSCTAVTQNPKQQEVACIQSAQVLWLASHWQHVCGNLVLLKFVAYACAFMHMGGMLSCSQGWCLFHNGVSSCIVKADAQSLEVSPAIGCMQWTAAHPDRRT
jgi:hypothetical protein